jgi:hypothetical protein
VNGSLTKNAFFFSIFNTEKVKRAQTLLLPNQIKAFYASKLTVNHFETLTYKEKCKNYPKIALR